MVAFVKHIIVVISHNHKTHCLFQGHSTLVYAGAGIVEGTNTYFEWDELDLKESQVLYCQTHEKYIVLDVIWNANALNCRIFSVYTVVAVPRTTYLLSRS